MMLKMNFVPINRLCDSIDSDADGNHNDLYYYCIDHVHLMVAVSHVISRPLFVIRMTFLRKKSFRFFVVFLYALLYSVTEVNFLSKELETGISFSVRVAVSVNKNEFSEQEMKRNRKFLFCLSNVAIVCCRMSREREKKN